MKGNTFIITFPNLLKVVTNAKIISSYGVGPKPVFNFFRKISSSTCEANKPNRWKAIIDLSPLDFNVGFIKVGDRIYGNKFKRLECLTTNRDFYSDKKFSIHLFELLS
jgi:hypothetical protein